MNILILCTYPVSKPMHGGQLRTQAIAETYRRAGHQVQVAGVLGSDSYAAEPGFDPFPGTARLASVVSNPFLMEDYALGELYASNNELFGSLRRRVEGEPALIHVEQPWLFRFAQRFAQASGRCIPLIYGSQNIEHRLKREILSSYFDAKHAHEEASRIEQLEREVIAAADGVVCVSAGDLAWMREQTTRPVVLAPNGVRAWQADATAITAAEKLTHNRQFALYCGSAHPPNMEGFFAMLGGGFGSLTPDQRLIIAGGAGYAIAGDARVHKSAKLAERTVVAGMVPQETLGGLLDCAHCIILPLTQGGGTNLKTAEALWAGTHIVGTTVAFRGFEPFMTAPGVRIADTPSAFKQAIREAMSAPPLQLDAGQRRKREVVLWQHCLNALPELAASLGSGSER